jgi:hypothetical protein
MIRITSIALFASLALLACSDSGSSTPDAAPSHNPDAATTADAAPIPDGAPGVDGAPGACTVSTADFGDKGALTGAATFDDGMTADDHSDDILEFDALLEGAQPADGIAVQLYAGYGAFAMSDTNPMGQIMPGTYELTGEELDFATCGVCVRIVTNTTSSGYEDDYFATGGTVTVTEAGNVVGGTLSGTLTNVQFHHVTIDPQTGATTQAPDTCTTGVTNATFTGTLAAPSTGP